MLEVCPTCGQPLPKHLGQGPPRKPVDLAQAIQLFAQGVSLKAAARQLGISHQHLINAVRRAGIDYRRSPKARLAALRGGAIKRLQADQRKAEKMSGTLDLGPQI